MHAPSARRRFLWVVLAAIIQLTFLLWAARAAVPQAVDCEVCDTAYYYASAVEAYTYGVSILFWLGSMGLLWWLAQRANLKTLLVAVA